MHPKSLISGEIAAFYEDTMDVQNDAERFFNINHTLKFKEIYILMMSGLNVESENQMTVDFKNLEYDDFLRIYRKIIIIFKHSQVVLKNVNIEELNFDLLGDKNLILSAFGNKTRFYERMENEENFGNLENVENVENVLLLTSILEFELGNIYYKLSGLKTPPHLLKDLLNTKELEIIFGKEALIFFKIVIGTPKAINLRNIVWHGFLKPGALPAYYVSTLLLVIHSFGHTLQAKNFKLIFRKQVTDFSPYLKVVCNTCNLQNNFDIDEKIYRTTINNCQWIPHDYKPYWQQLYINLKTATYWRLVILILPQLELILRLLYSKFNDFDVSAKLDEYYITLDTIFEPTVPNTANQQNCFFSGNCDISIGALYFIYDIFLAPKGPRIRDKISHGEVSMEAMNNQQLGHILLYLAFNLITQSEKDYPLAKYESQFHKNSFAKVSLNKLIQTCNDFKQKFEIKYEKVLSIDFIQDVVKIFQRPKKEPFYMHLITKIADLLSETCQNFEESIASRQSLLAHYELHSKRRRTLENLIKTLPKFCAFLDLLLHCLFEIYTKLQASSDDFKDDKAICIQRFFKHSLRIAENFVKYSHKDRNEWIKIEELSNAFDDIYNKVYLKFQENGSS